MGNISRLRVELRQHKPSFSPESKTCAPWGPKIAVWSSLGLDVGAFTGCRHCEVRCSTDSTPSLERHVDRILEHQTAFPHLLYTREYMLLVSSIGRNRAGTLVLMEKPRRKNKTETRNSAELQLLVDHRDIRKISNLRLN